MNLFFDNFKKHFTKELMFEFMLFCIPLLGIIIKSIIFQGFIYGKDAYYLNFVSGYKECSDYIGYYIAFAVLFLSFSLLFKGKSRVIYILILDVVITILCIIDIWYFRGFQTVPSILLVMQTSNLDNMSECIESMASWYDILYFCDLIVLGIYLYINKSYVEIKNRSIKGFLCTFIASFIFIIYIPFNISVLGNKDIKNGYLFAGYDPNDNAKYFSNVGYHVIDIYTVYRDSRQYKLTDEDKDDIEKLFDVKKENLKDNEYFGAAKGKNIIYIQVESLENFVIGKEIEGKEITPRLNELVNNSLYFPNTFEQVNEGTSSDCDFMVNTSLLPLRRGCTFFRYPTADYNSMPKILKNNGYYTRVIHPDKGSLWNYQTALSGGIGFDKFTDVNSLNVDETIGIGISDESYFKQVVPMIKDLKEPFYAMTITLSNHGPFNLPKEYRELNLNKELNDNKLGGYFESVHYTDKQIGNFLDMLKKEGILENSIVVIMGDHTGVHKYYNDDIDKLADAKDWYLDNGNHTVPLLIYDPSASIQAKTFNNLYNGQIDVMPTLLYLLGIQSYEYENTCLGRNLLNTNKSFAIITDGTLKGEENLSDEEIDIYKKSLDISDKIIRSK